MTMMTPKLRLTSFLFIYRQLLPVPLLNFLELLVDFVLFLGR
jgi:hypothetical protein